MSRQTISHLVKIGARYSLFSKYQQNLPSAYHSLYLLATKVEEDELVQKFKENEITSNTVNEIKNIVENKTNDYVIENKKNEKEKKEHIQSIVVSFKTDKIIGKAIK